MPEDVSKKIEVSPKVESGAVSHRETATVESGVENAPEHKVEGQGEATQPLERQGEAARPAAPVKKTLQQIREEQIDTILSEGLEEIYLGLEPIKQKEFRALGEVTVKKINALLSHAKINVKKIIILIKEWLALIPGVNKFFLEQEAKIKTDKVIRLK
jgi:hypothetical protein